MHIAQATNKHNHNQTKTHSNVITNIAYTYSMYGTYNIAYTYSIYIFSILLHATDLYNILANLHKQK